MEQAGEIAFNCLGAQYEAWAEYILGSCDNFSASHNTAENKNGATKKSPVGNEAARFTPYFVGMNDAS